MPPNATLDRLSAWCISLDSPVEEEVLKVQDQSRVIFYFLFLLFKLLKALFTVFLERILYQLSAASMTPALGVDSFCLCCTA